MLSEFTYCYPTSGCDVWAYKSEADEYSPSLFIIKLMGAATFHCRDIDTFFEHMLRLRGNGVRFPDLVLSHIELQIKLIEYKKSLDD